LLKKLLNIINSYLNLFIQITIMAKNNYTNHSYDDDDDELGNILFIYVIFFLGVFFIVLPNCKKYFLKHCVEQNNDDIDSPFDFEDDDDDDDNVEIGPNQRELKPDYDSEDDDENKYI
tara:strand:- start:27712 stop:28065 length:354 start_codon:yes stop_codon:yes gene_type:complete